MPWTPEPRWSKRRKRWYVTLRGRQYILAYGKENKHKAWEKFNRLRAEVYAADPPGEPDAVIRREFQQGRGQRFERRFVTALGGFGASSGASARTTLRKSLVFSTYNRVRSLCQRECRRFKSDHPLF